MRKIYTINAIQVVVSENHPEGVKSTITGFPIDVDSRTYGTETNPNGDPDTALIVAQAEFANQVKALTIANNANRVMWTVTLEQANGSQIAKKSFGAFPNMAQNSDPYDDEPDESEM